MIKYFVRTTNERILDDTYNQIEYEKLVDLEHRPVMSFIEQLEYINDYDAVFLEDDCQLCKEFKNRIEAVISQYPNRVINFFTAPKNYFLTKEAKTFYFNQCTYYPKGVAKKIATEMRKIEQEKPNAYQYDVLESKALEKLNMLHIQYRPCLVQHLDFKSLIGNRDNYRITPYFIDYLEELGISYEKANDSKNMFKLRCKILKEFRDRFNI